LQRVRAEVLERIMMRALAQRGVSEQHGHLVAAGLLWASLRGVDTHGVTLFPTYLRELDGGRARSQPVFSWTGDGGAMRVLDAGGALGLVAGHVAAHETVRLAKVHGVGAVSVRNSNHFGAASYFTSAMAEHDVVGLSFSNSDALVAPFNGARPLFGTNPISVAARGAGDELLCVDMATSQSSYSRIKQRRERGESIERGWALIGDGRDACDSNDAITALQPLGGYKGQCLSMIVELLCAILAATPCDHQMSHLYEPPFDVPRNVAHLFLAFDIARLDDVDGFRARLSQWLAVVRAQPGVRGAPVLVPGDLEMATHQERARNGIPLDAALLEAFRQIGGESELA
jgi:ureidoglycolate dehydrogenase (NAD+)